MHIEIMDCTLSDCGYLQNWNFGKNTIHYIVQNLTESKIDIINLGFIKGLTANSHRTIYPTVKRLSKQIGFMKKKVKYAISVDMDEPPRLSLLGNRKDGIIDIVNIIARKDKIKLGIEYCEKIHKNGYSVCLWIKEIDKYTFDEFKKLIQQMNTICPITICIADNFGRLLVENAREYFEIADEFLDDNNELGYYGQNTLNQVESVAKDLCSNFRKRKLLLMTSVGGASSCKGILPLENILSWEEFEGRFIAKNIINIYDSYIRFICGAVKNRYNLLYELSSKYRYDPNYIFYYENKLNLSFEETIGALKAVSLGCCDTFTENNADVALRTYRAEQWKNRLAVIIPTANRPESIKYYLETIIEWFEKFGIDFIVYDSSNDTRTKEIVCDFIQKGCTVLQYIKYEKESDAFSIDQKVIDAYTLFAPKYEYIWIMRDGLIINLPACVSSIKNMIDKQYDIIIVDDYARSYNEKNREYTKCDDLFREQIHSMTVLGLTIVKSEIILQIIAEHPLNQILNYGMWQPIAFFHYFAKHGVFGTSFVGPLFLHNIMTRKNAFWTKNLMWQWAERWYTMIDKLPAIYNKHKSKAWRIGMSDFHPFWPYYLIGARAYNGLTIKKYFCYKKYIPYVCDTAKWKFWGALILPKSICRYTIEHPESYISVVFKKIFKKTKKIYHSMQNFF